jgi:predicted phosphoribosyltransferase
MRETESACCCKHRIFDLPHLRNRTRVFHGRQEAADALAELLPNWFIQFNPLLLAISDAGYVLASRLARQFGLDAGFVPVQRVSFPWDNDVDYAAVAFDGTVHLDRARIEHNRLGQKEINKGLARALDAMQQEVGPIKLSTISRMKGRSVLLVDEGVATDVAIQAVLKALIAYRIKQPSLLVATAHDRALIKLSSSVKYIFCGNMRSGYSYMVDDAYTQPVFVQPSQPSATPHALRLRQAAG